MSQAFVVEVTEKPEITPEHSVESLAKAFNISARKIELMLKRLPGVATKPISEQEASVVVTYFEQAGLKALVKSVTIAASPTTSTVTSTTTEDAGGTTPSTELPSPKSSSEIAKERLENVYKFEETSKSQTASKPEVTNKDTPTQDKPKDSLPPSGAEVPMIMAEPSSDLLRALGEVSSTGQGQTQASFASGSNSPSYSSTSGAAVLSPPKPETRTEHDILRTTLIGEPDPRQTLTGQDVYVSSSSLPASAGQQRSSSLANKIMFTAILPILLTLLGTLVAAYFILQTALSEGVQSSARHPSTALAASLSSVLTETPPGEVNYTQLTTSIEATRKAFEDLPISFIAVTDKAGEVLPASWFESSTFITGQNVRETIREQALGAVSGNDTATPALFDRGAFGTASSLEVAAQPLMLNDQAIGAVVVGTANQANSSNLWQLLGRIALLSLIPLAVASLLTVLMTRPTLRRIHYLTKSADEISRGHLSRSVELKGDDELSALAEALERLRVSMQGALERLRRKR
jgi:HAMP domain-containing protein